MVTSLRTRLAAIIAVIAVVFSGLTFTDSATAAVVGAPTAPTAFTATGGIRSASLSWAEPTTPGTSAVSSYTVQWSAVSTFAPLLGSQTVTGTTASISNLSNTAVYYARVAASNTAGLGAWTTAAKFSTATKPAAPAGLKITPGVNAATVTWTAPTVTGGAPITGYVVQYSKDVTLATGVVTENITTPTASFTASGLLTATQYGFRVAAVNEIGTSAYSTIYKGSTATTAAAPSGTKAVQGNAQAVISWTPPLVNGGSAVTGYRIQYATDALFTTGVQVLDVPDAATKTYTITGLANGTKYFFRVASVNGVGAGAYAVAVFATTFAVPAAPTTLAAKPAGKGILAVSWKAPTVNGGSPVTSYTLEWSRSATFDTLAGTQQVTAPLIATPVTGLDDNTAYYFRAYANNVVGASPASLSATATTWNVPTAPNAPLAKSTGKGTVTVTWTAPANNGGTAVTGYTVEYSKSAAFDTVAGTLTVGALLTGTITGLEDGTAYYFRVKATNIVGTGVNSVVTAATTTFTAPAVPNTLTVAGGKNALVAKWLAPSSTGGSAVTGYRLQWSTASDFATVDGTVDIKTLTYTITGLTAGSTYYVRVAALNVVGAGAYTLPGSGTVFAAPSAPRNLVVTGGNAKVVATWLAPTSNGGAPLTSYLVEYSTDSTFATNVLSMSTTGTVLTASPSALTAGTTYYVRVTANNIAGASPISNIASATTVAAPAAPSNFVARATALTTVGLTWTAAAPNGSAVTGYTVQYSTDPNFVTAVTSAPVRIPTAPATPSYVVAGLAEGATYYFRVNAQSAAGSSAYATVQSATTWSRPAAPTAPAITSGVGSVATSWTAPDNTGSHPIIGYRILVATNSAFTNPQTVDTADAATTRQFVNFAGGTTYYVKIAAKTLAGVGPYSDAVSATTPDYPGAVTGATATWTTATAATVTWTAPANNGGSDITEYRVQYSPSATFTSNTTTISATGTSVDLTNLGYGTRYYVRIAAINAVGASANTIATNDISALRPAKPAAPSVVVASKTSLTATWTTPESNGCTINAYAVQIDDDSTFGSPITASTTTLNRTFTNLITGTTYYVRVQAANACGTSEWSTSNSAKPAGIADAPATPVVTVAGITSVTATWTAPSDNGSAITGYRVQYSNDRTFATGVTVIDLLDTTTTLTNLTTGSAVYVQVAAINDYGVSGYSLPGRATPGAKPSSPRLGGQNATQSMTADAKGALTVRWETPVDNGYPLTGFTVQYATAADFSDAVTVDVPVADAAFQQYSIAGLADGTNYQVRIAAVNELGTGDWSVVNTATTIAPPASVTDLAAGTTGNDALGLGYIDLAWTNPAGTEALYYHVAVDGKDWVSRINAAESSLRLNGVPFGQHTFTVTPENDLYGLGSATSITATVKGAPDAPAAPTITFTSCDSVDVAWTSPSNNSDAITEYTVSYGTIELHVPAAGTENHATVSLACGSTYDFKVNATNSIGTSAWSATATVTPDQAPSKITATAATNVEGVQINWTMPGLPYTTVDGYLVQYSTSPLFDTGITAVNIAGRTSTSYLATNLNPGSIYYVRVAAYNASGSAPWSDQVSAAYGNAPDAPTNIAASTLTRTSVSVIWSAPANDNGAPVIDYTIEYSDNWGITWNTFNDGVNVDKTAVITGLTPGMIYQIRVRAVNIFGTSDYVQYGAASGGVTTSTAPDAPVVTVPTVTSTTSADISWNDATVPGGYVESYTLEYSTDKTFGTGVTTVSGLTGTTYSATGLTFTDTYYFRVKAVNGLGSSDYSVLQSKTIAVAPTLNGYIWGGAQNPDGSIAIDWNMWNFEDPNVNGGLPVHTVTVEYAPNLSGSGVSEPADFAVSNVGRITGAPMDLYYNNSVFRVIATDVTPGVDYSLRVKVTTDAGDSNWNYSEETITSFLAPLAPNAPVATLNNDGSFTLTWTNQPADVAHTFWSYGVEYSLNGGAWTPTSGFAASTATSTTLGVVTAPGDSLQFRLVAHGVSDVTGDASTALVLPAAPTAPTNVTSTQNLSTITTTWSPSTADSLNVTYKVQYSFSATFDPNAWYTYSPVTSGTSADYALGSMVQLYAGQKMYTRVIAISATGAQTISDPSTVTLWAAPTQVIGVGASVASLTSANVAWIEPTSAGTPLTGYRLQWSNNGFSTVTGTIDLPATSTSTVITGLTTGTTYYFRVAGLNAYTEAGFALGGLNYGTSAGLQISTAPDAPDAPTATVYSATGATVTYVAPAKNGNNIQNYTVQYSTDATNWTTWSSTVSTSLSKTVTGLTNGGTYYFRVRATNGRGDSPWSPASQPLQIAVSPDAPTAISATVSGLTTVDVTWTPGASDGGATASYILEYSTDMTFATGVTSVTGISTTTKTVSVTNGSTYYFRVRATNTANGKANYSSYKTAGFGTLVALAPDAPATPTVTADSATSVTATWNAPIDNGAAIAYYTIQYSKDPTFTTNVSTWTETALSRSITGLTSGATYYFRVSATNNAGTSIYSASAQRLVAVVPGLPTGVTWTPTGANTATVSWTAPADNGSAITGYRVTTYPGGMYIDVAGNVTSVAAPGSLPSGTAYTATVTATNAIGTGASASSAPTTQVWSPDAPTAPTVTFDPSAMVVPTISWNAPADNGSAITSYTLRYSTDSTFATDVTTVTGITTTSKTISTLVYGNTYYFQVLAINAKGSSAYSQSTGKLYAAIPGIPTNVVWTATGASTATVTWTAPSSNGSPITGYRFALTPSTGTTITQSGTETTATISGLTAGTNYSLTVSATNDLGNSNLGSVSAVQKYTPDAPAAPTLVLNALGAGNVNVYWTAPAANGSAITSYTIQYSTDSTFATLVTTVPNATLPLTTINNLPTASVYYFRVSATNAVGTSAYSAYTAFQPADKPSMPTSFYAEPGTNTVGAVTITWQAPTNDGGTAVTGYDLQVSTDNINFASVSATPLSSTTTSYSFSGAPDTLYYFKIAALNANAANSTTRTGTYTTVVSAKGAIAPTGAYAPTVTVAPNSNYGYSYTIATTANTVVPSYYKVTVSPSSAYESYSDGRSYTVFGYNPSTPMTNDSYCVNYIAVNFGIYLSQVGYSYQYGAIYSDPYNYCNDSIAYNAVGGVGSVTTRIDTAPQTYNLHGNLQVSGTFDAPSTSMFWYQNDSYTKATYLWVTPYIPGYGWGTPQIIAAPLGTTPSQSTASTTTYNAGTATLNWAPTASDFTVTSYDLKYGPDPALSTGNTNRTGLTGTSYTPAQNISTGNTYYYSVRANSSVGSGAWSTPKAFYPGATAPSSPGQPPTVSTNIATSGSINVTMPNAVPTGLYAPTTGWLLQYSTDSTFATGVGQVTLSPTANLAYTLTGLTTGATYWFRLAAVNDVGTGAWKTNASAATLSSVPGAPTAVTFNTSTTTNGQVTWTAPTTTGGGIDYYQITPSVAGTLYFPNGSSTAVTANTTYNTPDTTTWAFFVPTANVASGATMKVAAHNGIGSGTQGTYTFAAYTKPTGLTNAVGSPTLSTGATVRTVSSTFAAATGAGAYAIYVSDSASIPATPALISQTAYTTATAISRTYLNASGTFGAMTSGTMYYVWVKPMNASGISTGATTVKSAAAK